LQYFDVLLNPLPLLQPAFAAEQVGTLTKVKTAREIKVLILRF